jgi:hypothetical protein
MPDAAEFTSAADMAGTGAKKSALDCCDANEGVVESFRSSLLAGRQEMAVDEL